jgi:hypothetical protein
MMMTGELVTRLMMTSENTDFPVMASWKYFRSPKEAVLPSVLMAS